MNLEGRVAVIVGAGSEIAQASLHRLESDGATVLAVMEEHAASPKTAGALGAQFSADVTTAEGARAVADECRRRWGRLDVLFYAASAIDEQPQQSSDEVPSASDWDRVFAINVWGPMVYGRVLLPILSESGGSIVFLTSIDGIRGNPTIPAFSTSKGALGVLTHVLACDAAGSGVRVNAVATAAISQFAPGEPGSNIAPGAFDRVVAATPLGRAPTADDVAGMVSFLASDDSAYLTGAVIPLDGGRLAGTPGTLRNSGTLIHGASRVERGGPVA